MVVDSPQRRFEYRPVAELRPHPRNARTHPKAQVEKIAASIREFGFAAPVLVDGTGQVLAGHGRLEAAKLVGLDRVPVVVLDDLTPAQARAYMLADNRIAEDSGYDRDLLKLELGELRAVGFDLELTGFSASELDRLLDGTAGKTDPDAVPQLLTDGGARAGDVWMLGRHRLACGDSTDAEVVARAIGGLQPSIMVTDPPYGVNYEPEWREELGRAPGRSLGKVINDDQFDWSKALALFPGDVAYVWCASLKIAGVQASLESIDFAVRSCLIWVKQHFTVSRGHYHWGHEPCLYAVRNGKTARWCGDRTQTTVWEISSTGGFGSNVENEEKTQHSTQKPVECMARAIRNHGAPGDVVYEPFSGSGTTIIAAHKHDRTCVAIELNPAYVDMAIRRWQAFTGEQATLDGTPYADVVALRAQVVAPA